MKKYISLSFVVLFAFQGVSYAQQSSFTLKQAIEYAKQNNRTLKNSRLDKEAAQKKINEIRSIGLPQVNAEGRFVYTPQIPYIGIKNPGFFGPEPTIEFPQGIDYSVNATITASQLLWDGSFLMGLKAAREFAMLSKINVERSEKQVEVDVTKAYYLVLITQENIRLVEKNIGTLEKVIKDSRALYQNGLTEKTELDRLELSYSNAQIQLNKLKDGGEISYYLLKLNMGLPSNTPIVLTDNLDAIYASLMTTDGLAEEKIDYNKRPEYKMLDQQLKLYNLDKKRYQYGYVPSLAAFVQHQENAFAVDFGNTFNKFYPGTQIGLTMRLSIFDGLQKSSQIQQARINIEKTSNDKEQLESAIETEVIKNRTTYLRSKEQVELQKKNMQLAEEIYNKSNIKYTNGIGSSLELTTAENDMKTSQTNYLNSIYDLLVAKTELEKSLGK